MLAPNLFLPSPSCSWVNSPYSYAGILLFSMTCRKKAGIKTVYLKRIKIRAFLKKMSQK